MRSQPPQLNRDEALESLSQLVVDSLPPSAGPWWEDALERARGGDSTVLAAIFPGLVRRCGKAPLVEPLAIGRFLRCPDFLLDLAAYRRADAAGALLVQAVLAGGAEPEFLRGLFDRGDGEERVTVMRALPLVGDHPVTRELLGEAQRSNVQELVEAAYCDHDLPARCLDEADFNRLVLKLAFLDLPFWRVLDGLHRANPELSRMLGDFAREREAAGRPIWADTLRLMGHAPAPGVLARLVGHLEHGRDVLRLAAAEGLAAIGQRGAHPELRGFVEERLAREDHPRVRQALERARKGLG